MKRALALGCAALALTSSLVIAQDAPESLLPPGFDDPAPAPSPRPTQRPAPARGPESGSPSANPASAAPSASSSVGGSSPSFSARPVTAPAAGALPTIGGGLPSVEELEKLGADELDELLGLKPKFDIPPASRRALEEVGLLAQAEGGLPGGSLAGQPASLVRAAVDGLNGRMVSRWGHILLRRALASRLTSPSGLNPVDFAASRARALNAMGEHGIARAVAQDVDTGDWNKPMLDAALDAYIGTADIVGACPAVQVKGDLRKDAQWDLVKNICYAFAGQASRSQSNLNRAFRNETANKIDVLLAQRYAGAAGQGRRAVNLEWDGVDKLTPWRFALANAVGAEIPANLLSNPAPYYLNASAIAPMLGLDRQLSGSDEAGRRGVLSSSAMIDLYSELYAAGQGDNPYRIRASRLRDAYVAADPQARLAAIKDVWGSESPDYARLVLTAYAAARITPNADMEEDAPRLIASMLAAGLDADALSWGAFVPQGSAGWALLALAQPTRANPVEASQVGSFIGDDESTGQRKSQFLVAGLAGLGRLEVVARDELASDLGVDFKRQTKWSSLINKAAEVNNPALVALLAGVGMQGNDWDAMTPRHLYYIVSALNRVGLSAEARMIAAEAVARG